MAKYTGISLPPFFHATRASPNLRVMPLASDLNALSFGGLRNPTASAHFLNSLLKSSMAPTKRPKSFVLSCVKSIVGMGSLIMTAISMMSATKTPVLADCGGAVVT
ncbi:unnamed protein product, partial [Ectocarpus sp. 12 AP-2014]